MTKRMLIDATHAEETRVVVLDGNRLEDFDVETAAKKQLKGNIYLAKVVRVEPSLQAAFVEYGGGRHGFLAFGEIHPDYYQIPVADRQRLLEMQEAEARAEEEADDAAAAADEAHGLRYANGHDRAHADGQPDGTTIEHEPAGEAIDAVTEEAGPDEPVPGQPLPDEPGPSEPGPDEPGRDEPFDPAEAAPAEAVTSGVELAGVEMAVEGQVAPLEEMAEPAAAEREAQSLATEPLLPLEEPGQATTQAAAMAQDFVAAREEIAEAEHHDEPARADVAEAAGTDLVAEGMEPMEAETGAEPTRALDVQSDPAGHQQDHDPTSEPRGEPGPEHEAEPRDDESRESRSNARFMRSYKIQEVIRRRQILLIQVVKEERGSKGAALTTYISLAGRFSVLMPNSPRGGGISRKITSTADRRRLKEVTSELQIPRGMGLIVRTAGANRPKAEIKRDCEYLLELWDSIRETTMASMAPALIHEEANLIRRAIRDNYSRDVDEVLVDGEVGWRAARDFMRMLMPAHARKVVLWTDPQPLFARQQVEAQLDAMLVPTVQLKSGGYLVINQTEALVAIDVNSGRSTRERGIEETALKTNLEASDEVARQLRLRDLAGLIVIDFIDMESRRNNAAVEKRMKDALKDDRARIQLGGISSFGLMEMSRQRLRPSLAETSFTPCPHCGGTGHVRSTETSALAVLRAIEDEGAKRRAAEIVVYVAGAIALYVLNHKRVRLAEIEARYGMSVAFAADDSLLPPETRIDRVRAQVAGEAPLVGTPIPISTRPVDDEDDVAEEDDLDSGEDEVPVGGREVAADAMSEAGTAGAVGEMGDAPRPGETAEEAEQRSRKRRRRRRGGRREEGVAPAGQDAVQPGVDPAMADQPELPIAVAETPVDGPDEAAAAEVAGVASAGPAAPGPEAAGLDPAGDDEARGRRRGRRGGRRRRRDMPGGEVGVGETSAGGDDAAGEGGADEPSSFDTPAPARPAYVAPVYAGPTPADPFGGGVFDIYDVMEQAEARAAAGSMGHAAAAPAVMAPAVMAEAAGPVPARPEAEAATAEATLPAEIPDVSEAGHADAAVPDAEPAVALDAAQAEPVPEIPPLPDAASETAPEAEPEPLAAAAITETRSAPPILIGNGDETGEKKRGWWRR